MWGFAVLFLWTLLLIVLLSDFLLTGGPFFLIVIFSDFLTHLPISLPVLLEQPTMVLALFGGTWN